MSSLAPDTRAPHQPDQRSGRHPANVVSLVFGVVFCSFATGALLFYFGVLRLADLQWAVPALFFGAGFLGVAASVLRNRSARTSR